MNNFLSRTGVLLLTATAVLIFSGINYYPEYKNGEAVKNSNSSTVCKGMPDLPDNSLKIVTKIIDGDTFLIEGGSPVRILGIDTDEKGDVCYQLAKDRLEEIILNKEVVLEKGEESLDKYCRYLRYVFLDDKNISLELIKEGLAASLFFLKDTKYKKEIIEAEKETKENKIGCKWLELAQ